MDRFLIALQTLSNENEMVCDFWVQTLTDGGDALLSDRLTAENLQAIERDALEQQRINGSV